MDYLSVKNWDEFQHYKDRNPPWIKLHRNLLRDYEFSCLQDASKLHLILIWLLASQLDNKIPRDSEWIKAQTGITGKLDLKPLIDSGFLIASNPLADCKQNAPRSVSVSVGIKEELKSSKSKKRAERFDEWWEAYGLKVNRKGALQIWSRRELDDMADELIADAKNRHANDDQWRRGYQPHPTTYLNQERWNDEITKPRQQDSKPTLPKDDNACIQFLAQRGIQPKPGESMWDFRRRGEVAIHGNS